MNINKRIVSLRALMEQYRINAFVINGNDPHLSEYVPAAWKSREWISGFTGSYGKVVITKNKAVLWTDSRYFIQAETQIKGSGILLMKDRQPDTIPYEDWIVSQLDKSCTVGINGLTISINEERNLLSKLSAKGIGLCLGRDLVAEIWKDRPSSPSDPAYDYSVKYAGISRKEKIESIRKVLSKNRAEATIISQLDDLAWTFNIRGTDIEFTPLVTGYGYIDMQRVILFIRPEKISLALSTLLESEQIEVRDYEDIPFFLRSISIKSIYLDTDHTNCMIKSFIPEGVALITGVSIPMTLKAVKNECEIAGMKEAHLRDAAAMINFLQWFYENHGEEEISELTICQKLKEFRSAQKHFIEESFPSIAGYAEHGAIVHYHPDGENNTVLKSEGIVLIDSGGQYLDGTTDITRTLSIGQVTHRQIEDYTLVLKGLIRLSKAFFPVNCTGHSLDILARECLWKEGLNYGHGTGHGIGHFSCVHEGPVSIRQDNNPSYLMEGHILSVEPGIYRTGEYGIRIENLILCCRGKSTSFGDFLCFHTLTLCPFDRKLINIHLLNKEEIDWINNYHQRIVKEVGPLIKSHILNWLENQCLPL